MRDIQERLVALGTPANEVLRRSRAESADSNLRDVLRFAVTIVITHGKLERADRHRLRRPDRDALVAAIVEAVADAYACVLRAETCNDNRQLPDFTLDVGDY